MSSSTGKNTGVGCCVPLFKIGTLITKFLRPMALGLSLTLNVSVYIQATDASCPIYTCSINYDVHHNVKCCFFISEPISSTNGSPSRTQYHYHKL